MVPKTIGKSWIYFEPKYSQSNPGFLFAFFNLPDNHNLYLYTKHNINDLNLSEKFKKACYDIDPFIEEEYLKEFTTEEYEEYDNVLLKNNLFGYKLYEVQLSEDIIKEFTEMTKEHIDNISEFRNYDNSDKYITYIVLRNDINCSEAMKMVYTSELTRSVALELMQNKDKYTLDEINSFFNGEGNTVILQASYEDLFVNNFIPTEYNNDHIIFDYYIDNEQRVAQNNFRLTEGTTVGLVFFGKKSELPKFIRKFKVWGDK